MRVLVISHGHPSLSLGGAEVASYNLHKGLQTGEGVDSHYLARVGAPTPRHAGTALMSLRQRGGELLYYAEDYDHFLISNRATEEIDRDFVRVLHDLKPDVVHFHHFIGLGLECLFAVRDALPDALIVVTFHEYLSICHHHGQMVKTGAFKLCYRASPTDCNACFPDISPARFLARETFIKGMLGLADHFVSPSRFLADRYVDWGLAEERFSVIENGIDVASREHPTVHSVTNQFRQTARIGNQGRQPHGQRLAHRIGSCLVQRKHKTHVTGRQHPARVVHLTRKDHHISHAQILDFPPQGRWRGVPRNQQADTQTLSLRQTGGGPHEKDPPFRQVRPTHAAEHQHILRQRAQRRTTRLVDGLRRRRQEVIGIDTQADRMDRQTSVGRSLQLAADEIADANGPLCAAAGTDQVSKT